MLLIPACAEQIQANKSTACSACPATIGKYLVVGARRETILQQVGPPNEIRPQLYATSLGNTLRGNGVFEVYHVAPYPAEEHHAGIYRMSVSACISRIEDDSSVYFVTYGSDDRIASVAYLRVDGTDSEEVKVPGSDGLILPAMLYRPHACSSARMPALVLLHGWGGFSSTQPGYLGLGPIPDLLAEQGYIVLALSMRGWGAGKNDCGLKQTADTTRAIE